MAIAAAITSRVASVRSRWSCELGIGASVLVALVLRFGDRLPDLSRVRHVLDGELGLIPGGRDLDRPHAEDAVEEALGHVHRADMLERDRGAVLAQDSLLV